MGELKEVFKSRENLALGEKLKGELGGLMPNKYMIHLKKQLCKKQNRVIAAITLQITDGLIKPSRR